jgi:hypothetical protein
MSQAHADRVIAGYRSLLLAFASYFLVPAFLGSSLIFPLPLSDICNRQFVSGCFSVSFRLKSC